MSIPIKNSFLRWTVLILFVIAISSCQQKPQDAGNAGTTASDSSADTSMLGKKVEKVFHSIPSPLQMSMLLKRANVKYSETILNPLSNRSHYTTNYSKALNLGVYGADLSYVNIFKQSQVFIGYLEASQKLADGLGLSTVLESTRVFYRIQSNLSNQDSMLMLISDLFRESDSYLKENQRYNTAVLILTGGWIEGVYLASKLAVQNNDKGLTEVTVGQKSSLNQLIEILDEFKDNQEFLDLSKDLAGLKAIYEGIEITYDQKDPATDETKKVTSLNTTSTTKVNQAQIAELAKHVEIIRNKIVKPN